MVLLILDLPRRTFMKASETNILKFIGGLDKVFIIPPFQRNYEWSFDNSFDNNGIIKEFSQQINESLPLYP